MAARAPSTLPTEIAQTPSDANTPSSSTAVAPTLAPDDTPSRNGSASALRTRTCTTAPAVVRAAPTTAASRTRGSRICQTISSATVLSGWPDNWSTMTCHTTAGLSATDPIPTPRVTVIRSSRAQATNTTDSGRRSMPTPLEAVPPRSRARIDRRGGSAGIVARRPSDRRPGVCGEPGSGTCRVTLRHRSSSVERPENVRSATRPEVRHEPPFLRELFRRRRAGDRTRP